VSEARTLVLVDGSSYLYRAFHALPPLTNSRGEPTGAVLGVLNMLLRMQREQDPPLVAVVFDAPGKTFRDELFAEYKSHRPPMPDDLRVPDRAAGRRGAGRSGCRCCASRAWRPTTSSARWRNAAVAAGLQVLISTGDKDMAQLVDERVTLVNTMTNSSLDRAGVKIKFDVYPEQIVDYLALVGDASDNIPRRAQGGSEDRGQVAQRIPHARQPDGAAGQDRGQGGRKPAQPRHDRPRAVARQLAKIRCDVDLDQSAPKTCVAATPDVGQPARAVHAPTNCARC
jgi:DNA polymerase I